MSLEFQRYMYNFDRQHANKQLVQGEYKGRRYFCVVLGDPGPRVGPMDCAPSKAYWEIRPAEFEQAADYYSMARSTWCWFPDYDNEIMKREKAVTEEYVEGINYTGELGIDCQEWSKEKLVQYVQDCIDDFDEFVKKNSRRRSERLKRKQEAKDALSIVQIKFSRI